MANQRTVLQADTVFAVFCAGRLDDLSDMFTLPAGLGLPAIVARAKFIEK